MTGYPDLAQRYHVSSVPKTVVGESVPEAVYRAIYTEMNARLQLQATQLEGPIEFLSDDEGRRSQASNRGTLERPWELWKKNVLR